MAGETHWGGPVRAAPIGAAVIIGSLMLAFGHALILITKVSLMCLGMFFIRAKAALKVNHNTRSMGDFGDDLLVSCYYSGSALGAWSTGIKSSLGRPRF